MGARETGEQHPTDGEDQDHEPEDDPWPAQREGIRTFVEYAVAAGAAGHSPAKGRGARLDGLLAPLAERGATITRKALADLLDRAGIPVREQMKFRSTARPTTSPPSTSTTSPRPSAGPHTCPPGTHPRPHPRSTPYATPAQAAPEEEPPTDD